MLPEGWKIREVGEIFEVQLGKMLSPTAKELSPQLPYLTNFNVRWGNFDLSRLNSMHFSERDKDKFSLKPGDLLMCEGGEVGRCAIWNHDIECYYQKALHRLRSKGPISNIYFQQYMNLVAGSKLLEDYTSRTSIAHLTREKLLQLPVRLPPQEEQHAIAQILSTWDQAIATTEKLIENSKAQKKALMQQLLTGKKRLPGLDAGRKDYNLCEVATITMGSSPKSSAYNNNKEGLPLIQGNADIKNRKSSPRTFTSEITKRCEAGDILLSVRAPVGTVSISQHLACIGRGIAALKSNEKLSQSFLYQWLLWFEPRWACLSQGSTFESVNSSDIKTLPITLPSINEQKKISNILETADKQVENLLEQKKKLKLEKKALMQQLLTGKRRVKVDP